MIRNIKKRYMAEPVAFIPPDTWTGKWDDELAKELADEGFRFEKGTYGDFRFYANNVGRFFAISHNEVVVLTDANTQHVVNGDTFHLLFEAVEW